MAGKGSLRYDHPINLGAIGVTGTLAANRIAREADPGDRDWHALQRLHDGVQDCFPASGCSVRQRQRGSLRRRQTPWAAAGWRRTRDPGGACRAPGPLQDLGRVPLPSRAPARRLGGRGRPYLRGPPPAAAEPGRADRGGQRARRSQRRDGLRRRQLAGDLHKLWRARHPKQFHLEYGYSCMGYEIAEGWAPKWPSRLARSTCSSETAAT